MKRPPMFRPRSPSRGSAGPKPAANITPGHVRAFQMVTSPLYQDQVCLHSCTINGEPGVAIIFFDEIAEGKVGVMPLFVAITPGMKVEFDGTIREGEGDGGGPERPDDIARQFTFNAATLVAGGGE